MRFAVRHDTIYRYRGPVRLGAHLLRLTPRAEGLLTLSQEIEVDPAPVARIEEQDVFGNRVTRLEFAGETRHLRLSSRFEAVARPDPPEALGLPALPWGAGAREGGSPAYLGVGEAEEVALFARALAQEAGGEASAFLDLLNARLHARIRHGIRPEGAAQDAPETLASGHGACRDTAVLFIAACRSLGMPARFVSGYQARPERTDRRRHLHAWPEVRLPGAGWRGYDPTHGTRVGGGHVALAAAPGQGATMPVEGGFWGDGAGAEMAYELEIVAE